jgi:hypothetical protein
MTKRLPPPGWYLQPNSWAYSMPDVRASLWPGFPRDGALLAPTHAAMQLAPNGGLLGQQTASNPPVLPVASTIVPRLFSPPWLSASRNAASSWAASAGGNAESLVPTAMPVQGVSAPGLSPAAETAPAEDARRTAANRWRREVQRWTAAPQLIDRDLLASSLEHLDSAEPWGAVPAPPHASEEQPGSDEFRLSSVPQARDRSSLPPRATAVPVGPSREPAPTDRSFPSGHAGNPDVGSWGSGVVDRSDPRILSDVTPDNYWIPGADYAAEHHEFPQAHYRRMPRETRKVFDQARVGELFLKLDGRGHEYDAFHREYNKATGELLEKFMEKSNIAKRPEQMTPDHAHAVLKEIAESEDPRIRLYREFVRRLRMFYRLRIGRGTE